jgi:predicted amidophosphoribosyltransferase
LSRQVKFCPECGAKIQRQAHCSACGAALDAGTKFCGECGAKTGK